MVLMACFPLKRRNCKDLAFLHEHFLHDCVLFSGSVSSPLAEGVPWMALQSSGHFFKKKNHRKAGVTRYFHTAWLLTLRCCLDCTWQHSNTAMASLKPSGKPPVEETPQHPLTASSSILLFYQWESFPGCASDHHCRQLKFFFSRFSQRTWKEHLLSLFRGALYALGDCYRVVPESSLSD